MAIDDYAIVVGITRYPRINPPEPGHPHHLSAPDRDATAIYDWLTDPQKGAVPDGHAMPVRSRDFPDSTGAPDPDEKHIEGAFRWLYNQKGQNGRIGRRLYLYFSGHGFGTHRNDGGVYMATADPLARDHVYVSAWLEWFHNAYLFDEYVLWFDACMSRLYVPVPRAPTWAPQVDPDAANAKVFVAFAARHPAKAVENTMPDGLVHGAFTYALLAGLNGDAADASTGVVTTSSLQKHLRETMRTWMKDEDIADPDVSSEPDFGPADPIELVRVGQSKQRVRFLFPGSAAGYAVRVETGNFQTVETGTVQSGEWVVHLANGIYKLIVDASGETRTFEVRSADSVIDLR